MTFEHKIGLQVTPPAEDTAAVALSPEEAEQRRKFEEIWDAKTIEQGWNMSSVILSYSFFGMKKKQFCFLLSFVKRNIGCWF